MQLNRAALGGGQRVHDVAIGAASHNVAVFFKRRNEPFFASSGPRPSDGCGYIGAVDGHRKVKEAVRCQWFDSCLLLKDHGEDLRLWKYSLSAEEVVGWSNASTDEFALRRSDRNWISDVCDRYATCCDRQYASSGGRPWQFRTS